MDQSARPFGELFLYQGGDQNFLFKITCFALPFTAGQVHQVQLAHSDCVAANGIRISSTAASPCFVCSLYRDGED